MKKILQNVKSFITVLATWGPLSPDQEAALPPWQWAWHESKNNPLDGVLWTGDNARIIWSLNPDTSVTVLVQTTRL